MPLPSAIDLQIAARRVFLSMPLLADVAVRADGHVELAPIAALATMFLVQWLIVAARRKIKQTFRPAPLICVCAGLIRESARRASVLAT